ncbi:palmitoleoyl-protein carboxylesterase notum2-like isoform X2 [Lissotriton helveticus]
MGPQLGGWFCFSKDMCDMRYKSSRRLMSSSEWSQTRKGSGILSAQADENPYWWNANVVYVPYCSSDMWSGTLAKSGPAEYAFMGSLIIQEVIKDLAPKGIKQAKIVMLAGVSAGALGVLLNIDQVAAALQEMVAESVQVRGVVDSGWFLDLKPLNPSQCVDALHCTTIDAIKNGLRLWGGILPDTCRQQFKKNDEWQCLMGDKLQPSLKTPIFLIQWLFDEEQLKLENIHLGVHLWSERQWNGIQSMGREIKSSLRDIPAVFVPACFSHVLITKSNWLQTQVKGHSVARALQCWERSLSENNKTVKAPARGCSFHLIDNCPWPQCNPTCPALHDPITGKEISIRQVLQKKDVDYHRKGS